MNRRSIVFALVVFSIAANLFSQSQTSSGDIRGTIVDSTGGVLPGAAITITNIDTRVERSATSDTFGNFRVFLLTPGEYELKIQLAGFSTYVRRPVQVTVGETVSIASTLQPASVQQEVLVQDVAPQVEPEKT